MKKLKLTTQFRKDLKKAIKQGKNLNKLETSIEMLQMGAKLEVKYKVHLLKGSWAPCWECYLEPDWLLIWQEQENHIILVRTGTHSDLFK